jgi:formylglycine-generating enzyme required for sulfatase activity
METQAVEIGDGVELDLVLIPAGNFVMGSPKTEKDHFCDEEQNDVILAKSFYLGKYVVTQEQWESVMEENSSELICGKLPVTNVSWIECQGFIKKLNEKTKLSFRLPTEAEWEYACRAGSLTAYSIGDNITANDANFAESQIDKPVSVGSYKPNAFGLYDMHGNVLEWCDDWYGEYSKNLVSDIQGIGTKQYRVLRGGSFACGNGGLRSSNRESAPPDRHDAYDWGYGAYGFRLVLEVDVDSNVNQNCPVNLTAEPQIVEVKDYSPSKKAKDFNEALVGKPRKNKYLIEDLGDGVILEMALIPAGNFTMGSSDKEKGRHISEVQHEVTITKDFYLGKYEVTQAQWEMVMSNNSTRNEERVPTLPVTSVSWYDCQDFIKKLNKKLTGKTKGKYRLPTEAEWEYACRAGSLTEYSFGNKITPKNGNYSDSKIYGPVKVGSFKANAFGLYDMHGNVFEWCEDIYCDYLTNPKGLYGQRRVLRGGSFGCHASSTRSAFRDGYAPRSRDVFIGFRLARTL